MEESELIGNAKCEDLEVIIKISSQDDTLLGMIENLNDKVVRQTSEKDAETEMSTSLNHSFFYSFYCGSGFLVL